MICPVCGKGELEMDHIWHGQDVSISHLACVEKMQDGAKRLVASNERLLKRAELAEAELAALADACITREQHNNIVAQKDDELAALKCCGNCGRYDQKQSDERMYCYAFSDPDECEDASPFDRCHFIPSRWAARAEEGGE